MNGQEKVLILVSSAVWSENKFIKFSPNPVPVGFQFSNLAGSTPARFESGTVQPLFSAVYGKEHINTCVLMYSCDWCCTVLSVGWMLFEHVQSILQHTVPFSEEFCLVWIYRLRRKLLFVSNYMYVCHSCHFQANREWDIISTLRQIFLHNHHICKSRSLAFS